MLGRTLTHGRLLKQVDVASAADVREAENRAHRRCAVSAPSSSVVPAASAAAVAHAHHVHHLLHQVEARHGGSCCMDLGPQMRRFRRRRR